MALPVPVPATPIKGSWWKEDEKKRGGALVAIGRELRQEQVLRRERLADFFRLYGNFNARAMTAGAYNKPPAERKRNNRLTFNLVQSAIDTVVAKIAKNSPKPTFLTDGGKHSDQVRAKHLEKIVTGAFYEGRVKKKAPIVFRDSCIFGTGAMKVAEDPVTNRLGYERVLVDELFVDDVEAMYGDPRSLYYRRVRPREMLLGQFCVLREGATKAQKEAAARLRKIIEGAPVVSVGVSGISERGVQRAEMIETVEAWHLPSSRVPECESEPGDEDYLEESMAGHDGRHSIALPDTDGTVIFQAWRKNYFPFAFMHWTDPVCGMWGQGAADQLFGFQYELNELQRIVQQSARLCIPKLYVDKGAKVSRAHLDDLVGAIIEGNFPNGQYPQMVQWNGISAPLVEHVERIIRQGYEVVGVSLMSASGRKPSGLESGAALREYHDIETERFVMAGKAYEEFHMELARQTIEAIRDIAIREDDGYEVTATRRRSTFKINCKDLDLAADSFIMQVFPTSALPHTPAGRLAMIQDLFNMGFLDRDTMIRLLDFPDLESENELAEAAAEFTDWQMEEMIERGISRQPEPYQNIQYSLKHAESAYLRARQQEDVPPSNLELVRNFIAACQELIRKTAPPAIPPMPGGPVAPPMIPGAPGVGGPPPGPPGIAPPMPGAPIS